MAKESLLLLLIFFSLTGSFVFSAEGDKIKVEKITPGLTGSFMSVSADFENLFSKRIVGTIQSGLPSIIQIDIKLVDASGKSITRKQISRKITYDIWEERYKIESPDSVQVYTDFEVVKSNCSKLQNELLVSTGLLEKTHQFIVQIQVGIVPISSKQADKVTDWLLEPNQTTETLPEENRSSGFQLNLNKLVSFFVSSRKKSDFSSDWFSSPKFKLMNLQQ